MPVLHLLAQVIGVAAALLGLYLLAGPAWALLAFGLAVLAASTFAEFVAHRVPADATRGDR